MDCDEYDVCARGECVFTCTCSYACLNSECTCNSLSDVCIKVQKGSLSDKCLNVERDSLSNNCVNVESDSSNNGSTDVVINSPNDDCIMCI